MIRKNTNGDISDEEFEAILRPFIDDYNNFIISYIMPEVIAYYIANSYYRGSMYEGSFLQHYNSAKDLINYFDEDYEKAGVKQIRLHDFRNSCTSLLIHKEASINIVAKYLGHTKIEETLNTYSHLYTNALSDITNLINEMQKS